MAYVGNQNYQAYVTLASQTFTTSGSTTIYSLSYSVSNANNIALYINNVPQQPSVAYTAAGNTLTLTTATSSSMYAVYLGQGIQTTNLPVGVVGISNLSASGTANSSSYLRGDNTWSSLVTGKVLQVVQSTKTDTASVTATSYSSLGLSVSITPSSTSSNILVLVNAKVGWVTGQLRYTALFRNSTQLLMPTSYGSRQQASLTWTDTSNSQGIYPAPDMYLDSPATTSSISYTLNAKVYSSGTIYINRSSNDGDGGNDARTASSIIAMEIGA